MSLAPASKPRVIFITGTDTGVGKTVLTGLLLAHLRRTGCPALAIKPFCSGSRADARLLHALQDGELSLDEVNPYFFDEPVAPLVAARRHRRVVPLQSVLDHAESILARMVASSRLSPAPIGAGTKKASIRPCLLIEGAGGLLAPLGEGYSSRDIIARLGCEVIVVARNKLGTINHTLLTLEALSNLAGFPPHGPSRCPPRSVVLMDTRARDASRRTNTLMLSELMVAAPLLSLPFLGTGVRRKDRIGCCARSLSRSLGRLLRKS